MTRPRGSRLSAIVADVQVRGARGTNVVETYVPYWHNPEAGTNVVLKTAGDPAALAEPLRRAVKESIPASPSRASRRWTRSSRSRTAARASTRRWWPIFAGLALLLAAVGIYGVMSYAVTQRTQEIGVRLALGAGERQIFGLVVGESLKLAAVGLAIGLAGSLAARAGARRAAVRRRRDRPATFAVTAALLAGVAFLAAYVPARRAMRIDPMEALRVE